MCAGMPYYTDAWSRSAAGRITPSGRPTSAFRCLIAMNYKKEGALSIYLAVDLDVVAWSSASGATGGGRRVPLPSRCEAESLLSQVQTLRCLAWGQEKVRVPGPIGAGKEEPESI